jgi:N-acetylmuramic acid 6-phosphate etherase
VKRPAADKARAGALASAPAPVRGRPRGRTDRGRDALYAALPTEAALPAARELDALGPLATVRLMLREERRSARAALDAAPAIAAVAAAAAAALGAGGSLVYVGAGTSGRLATLDAAECGPTFGARPGQVRAVLAGGARALRRSVEGAEDDAAAGGRLRVRARDLVVGVAASGLTPFVAAALAAARRAGAGTALITCAPAAARAAGVGCDHLVALDVGPEVLAGSTRLKAGTATKLALNAISTAAMVQLGKCYGPYMVDVVPTNAKLGARARRLVARLGGCDDDAAARLLDAARGHAKIAIAMARLGVSRRAAERALASAGGQLRVLLGPP